MSEPSFTKNQRRSRRSAPWGKVRVTCQRGAVGLGPNLALGLLDVSETGVRLRVKDSLRPGRVVALGLEGPSNSRPLTRLGTIIWSVPSTDGSHCVGISFPV